jgi:hydroxymethylbilane synthase
VADAITAATGRPVELQIVSTRGDRDRTRPLAQLGGKGLFTQELEDGLRAGQLDLAVHSLKDLPTDDPDGLVLGCFPLREDPRDAFVGPPLAQLAHGARIGSGSLRRRAQILALRPDLELVDIRGNVDTRLRKVDDGTVVGTILAMAGMNRLGIERADIQAFTVDQMVPAVGQGALGVQCRADDALLQQALAAIDHAETRRCVTVERSFLSSYGGGCNVPAACHAWVDGADLCAVAVSQQADGILVRRMQSGRDPQKLGQSLAAAVQDTDGGS